MPHASLRRFCIAIVAAVLALVLSEQVQSETISPTGRQQYLVTYRSGSIPGDAEARAAVLGGRLVRRHEAFGLSVVEMNATQAARLRQDEAVASVVADRMVHGGTVMAARTDRLTGPPLHKGMVGMKPVEMPQPDLFYSQTPQGWAVKAVGGFGQGIEGSTVPGAWNTTTGKGVRIAVLDSGVDGTHPDIAPNLALNMTEVDIKALPSACDDGSPEDQSGHGTWVASLAAGALGPDTGAVAGVAPSATILNIKVLERLPGTGADTAAQCTNGQASGMLSWVIQGVEDAVAQHADVAILSLGTIVDLYTGDGSGLKATFDQVTYAAAQAGTVLVAAAGNDGYDLSNTRYMEIPAQSRGVLAVVASTNPDCAENMGTTATCAAGPITLPYYSNRGALLDAVAAPGGSYPEGPDTGVSGWVRGACSSGIPGTADGLPDAHHSYGCFGLGHQEYVQAMGTSASAPLVAGVAALVRAAHPDWSADTVVAALRSSAKLNPTLGYGIVNASAAIAYKP